MDTYWRSLLSRFDRSTVRVAWDALKDSQTAMLTADTLVSDIESSAENAANLLDQLATDGVLRKEARIRCDVCGETQVFVEDSGPVHCENDTCDTAIDLDTAAVQHVYHRLGTARRDVRWFVIIHGMNTQGAWQESFSWRLAQNYGYSVPVSIFKFGHVFFTPFMPRRSARYVKRFADHLRHRQEEVDQTTTHSYPDVVAHSFGTWLLKEAIEKNDDLRVGRIILTGSIVPPDFDWRPLIDAGRVQAVLCHRAPKDWVVPWAQFGIPRSGPSGILGFNDDTDVHHELSASFSHSSFFTEKNLPTVMSEIWGRFLTIPKAENWVPKHSAPPKKKWKLHWFGSITRPLRWVLLALIAIVVSLFVWFGFSGIWCLLFTCVGEGS